MTAKNAGTVRCASNRRAPFTPRAWVICLAAAATGACSSKSSSGPAVAADISGACGDYFDAQVSATVMCGGIAQDPTQQSTDRARAVKLCVSTSALPSSGVTPSALAACVALYKSAKCDDPVPNCDFHGGLPTGAVCAVPQQCSSSVCKPMTDADAETETVCGVCTAKVATGANCDQLDTCADPTAFCVMAANGKNSVCQVAAGQGQDCTAGPCAAHLVCDTTGKRAAPHVAGDACVDDSLCAFGLACVAGKCATPTAVGGACADGLGCALNLACDTTAKTCAAIQFAGPAAVCKADGTVRCDVGPCVLQTKTAVTGGCPSIVSDGMSCNPTDLMHHCDSFANCVNDVCTLGPATTCM